METLPKDILVEITLKLELSDVLNLCFSKKIFNQRISENYIFWSKMLKKDFNINYNKNNSRDIYKEVNKKFKNAIESTFDEGYYSSIFDKGYYSSKLRSPYYDYEKPFFNDLKVILSFIIYIFYYCTKRLKTNKI